MSHIRVLKQNQGFDLLVPLGLLVHGIFSRFLLVVLFEKTTRLFL